jgi:peroxiredoxin
MKKINLLTVSALLLMPFAVFQSYINFPFVAAITATIAFMFVFVENQKITSRFQHFSMPVIALFLGFVIERNLPGFPFIALAILTAVAGLIARMVFIKTFSYSKFRYFELMTLMIAACFTFLKVKTNPQEWIFLFPVYIILMMLMVHSYIIVKNAFMLEKGAKAGYNASVGVEAPDFLLPDQFGNGVTLSEYKGKRHILLIFVRGDWCPYCHMIMRTYMRESERFKQKNIMLMAVGPDPVGINREMAQKLGLDYLVLSDEKMLVAQEYGIRLPDFELPMSSATFHEEGMPLPASFLIDKNGMVVYTSRTEKPGEYLDPRLIFPIVENLN